MCLFLQFDDRIRIHLLREAKTTPVGKKQYQLWSTVTGVLELNTGTGTMAELRMRKGT